MKRFPLIFVLAFLAVCAGNRTRAIKPFRSVLASSTLLALVLTGCLGLGGSDFTVNISSPAGTAYTNGTLNVQATVTGGTPESLELLRDSTPLASLSAPNAYAWDTSALPEGSYSLGVRATKGGKSVQGEARTVFVDRTAPTVSLSSSTVSLAAAGNLDLSAEASDSRGIASVEFFDGAQKVGEATSSPFALSLNLSSSDNRDHTFSAIATDRAGNKATSTALRVNVVIPKRVSENLIVNGDAEAGPQGAGNYVSNLPGWLSAYPPSVLRFTVAQYGTSGLAGRADAPPNAGNNFFAGGPDIGGTGIVSNPDSTVNSSFQIIALPADWNAAVDAGTGTFELSGYFGSIGNLGDFGLLTAFFEDSNGKTLKSVTLETVSAVDRGGKSGFIRRFTTNDVPKLTRKVFVLLRLIRTTARGQYNVGLADNLSLVLKSY
jgi:hypothetical protein